MRCAQSEASPIRLETLWRNGGASVRNRLAASQGGAARTVGGLGDASVAERRGYRALLIVTGNYHTGRARLTFRKALRRSEARLAFVAATPDWVHWDRCWTEERLLLVILQEYIKLGFYLFKGYLI